MCRTSVGEGRVDFHRGVVRATVTEKVDGGAPDGDGPLVVVCTGAKRAAILL